MLSVRLRTALLVSLAASGLYAVQACSEPDDAPTNTAASGIRNDGKQPDGTNPGKLSCEDQAGLSGFETVVDLGGVNRTLDLGGGLSIVITNAKGLGSDHQWSFDFEGNVVVGAVLLRSGNKDSIVRYTPSVPANTLTHVERSEAEGPTKTGLNRIAFCFQRPPPPPDAGPPPPDSGPPPPPDAGTDGGQTW